MSFVPMRAEDLTENVFSQIGKNWFLVAAGTEKQHNAMTVSWGGLGVLWGKNVVTLYLRQSRYTKEIIDREGLFTLSSLGPQYRRALSICGSKTGRDCDKFTEAGLTPYYTDGTTAAAQAEHILVCRTVYSALLDPKHFIDSEAETKWYADHNWHSIYIGEILRVLTEK